MNKFLFITHLTPAAKRSALRHSLLNLYFTALEKQTYPNWKVLQIGEQEKRSENFFEVGIDPSLNKEARRKQIAEAYDRVDVREYISEVDYVIKLDDDDIISPFILEKLKDFTGDMYFDKLHTFYDVSSGQITAQNRIWLASTCVHKAKHAFAKMNPLGPENIYENSILYTDHSKVWHQYYNNRNCSVADPKHPVYLRVLSPTSITAGAKKFPLDTVKDVDFDSYFNYLHSFGDWKKADVRDFDKYLPALTKAWVDFSGMELKSLKNVRRTSMIGNKLKKLFISGKK